MLITLLFSRINIDLKIMVIVKCNGHDLWRYKKDSKMNTMNVSEYTTAENAAFINGVHHPLLKGRKAVARTLGGIINFKGGYRAAYRLAAQEGYSIGELMVRRVHGYGWCLTLA